VKYDLTVVQSLFGPSNKVLNGLPNAVTIEDPVTGTASGVMGAYYATYLEKDFDHEMELVVEQGQEMNKDGRVTVYVTKDIENEKLQIDIAGTAVYVKEFEVSI